GYWTWDWSDSYQKIQTIDLAKNEITIAEPHHHYGYTKNQRYYFLNILEELDQPGEWVLDRNSGLLYFYPPAAIPENEVFVSMVEQTMVVLENCENVSFQGIHFEFSRGNGIVINGGNTNLIAGCTFRNLGGDAVVINNGRNNGITSCDIYDVSMGGIHLRGGDRKKLVPANNFAVNNDIYDYSQWIRTGQLAINLLGVGNRIAHNVIHDAPHGAIYVQGNEHLLEFNEIYNVCYETGDAGAIHTGRNYTWRGNVYRYNYVHHLKGPGLHGCTALYLDDFTSGYTLYGNICYKSGRGALLGGGRDNVVENNIFIGCAPTIVQDARGLAWASNYFDGEITVLTDSLKAMNFREPPYSEKYPELLTLYNDEPAVPKNNKIIRNISYGGRFIERYDYFAYDPSVVTIKDNVIADSIIYKQVKQAPIGWEPYYLNLDTEDDYIYFKQGDKENVPDLADNLIIDSDPGFENIEQGDFRLKSNSPAFKIGFKKIPIEKIGLFVDEYRRNLLR
ncbi:right-handed parallel beta-helix repeat-containing protein, partial [candidate division KSB1 bacterium]|nr:right-handed parallel beta-helix repeat-containing protein [candidate division KSB1 bacterium]